MIIINIMAEIVVFFFYYYNNLTFRFQLFSFNAYEMFSVLFNILLRAAITTGSFTLFFSLFKNIILIIVPTSSK